MSTDVSTSFTPKAGSASYRPLSYLSSATGVMCVFETTEQKGCIHFSCFFFF